MGRPNDPLLHFKRGLAKGRKIFRTARLVSDPDRYRLACTASGTNAEDLHDFFPAYRRPAPEISVPVTAGDRTMRPEAVEAVA
jgi:hypothetical protein